MSKLDKMLLIWSREDRNPAVGCYEPPKYQIYKKRITNTSLLGIRCYEIPCVGCAWNTDSDTLELIKELEQWLDSIR